MIYRKKLRLLSLTAALLALVCAGTFIFDARKREEKRSGYTWISRELLEQADRIEIAGMPGPVILERINNVWVMPLFLGEADPYTFRDFPVKQSRVAGLFTALSRRAQYPLRSAASAEGSASGLQRLGLTEGQASRITVRGGAGRPLLDLLIGFGDAAGSTIYFRKAGSGEARSGEDIFSVFTETGRKSWLDLSLFGNINLDMVQRVFVYLPEQNGSYLLSRSGRDWTFTAQGESLSVTIDRVKAESWLRSVINAEADDFDYFLQSDDPVFSRGSVILELGDGTSRILRLGSENENKSRPAAVSGVGAPAPGFVYTLTEGMLSRLFPGVSYFTAP